MKRFLLLLIFNGFFFNFIFAQSGENYTKLESKGEIPQDFTHYLSDKLSKDEQVYHDLIMTGLLVYGSPLNDYIETIVDNILVKYPELRKELRFYIVKSPVVNAYTYPNGMILVNTGLLAQCQNESELAFILAHEIVHYAEKHTEKAKTEAKKDKKKNRQREYKSYYLAYQNRSREHEKEVDQLAFQRYFKDSQYSYDALDGVFDVLLYSSLPFDNIPFNRSFVENEYYQFPEEYFLSSVNPISEREDYVDTISTHPNLEKRRAWVAAQVRNIKNEGRQLFIQPESIIISINIKM